MPAILGKCTHDNVVVRSRGRELMKLGKRPASTPRAYHLSRYVAALEAPPVSYDRSEIVLQWGMLGNDNVGDCVFAAIGHAVMLWSAATQKPRVVTTPEALAAYSAVTGYVAGDPNTDSGADPQAAMRWWAQEGFTLGGVLDKLAGWCSLSPTRDQEAKFAIWRLGCVNTGLALPAAIEAAFSDNTIVWDIPPGQSLAGDWAPGSLGGHDIQDVGYDSEGVVSISWGQRYKRTWAFDRAYADEKQAMLSRDFADAVLPAQAWSLLESDMTALRSSS